MFNKCGLCNDFLGYESYEFYYCPSCFELAFSTSRGEVGEIIKMCLLNIQDVPQCKRKELSIFLLKLIKEKPVSTSSYPPLKRK